MPREHIKKDADKPRAIGLNTSPSKGAHDPEGAESRKVLESLLREHYILTEEGQLVAAGIMVPSMVLGEMFGGEIAVSQL